MKRVASLNYVSILNRNYILNTFLLLLFQFRYRERRGRNQRLSFSNSTDVKKLMLSMILGMCKGNPYPNIKPMFVLKIAATVYINVSAACFW